MLRASRSWLTLFVALAMGATLTVPGARAANIPMYDGNTARTRMVSDPSLSPTQLYLSVPTYLPLPGQSLSTPTVVGNTLYQYTYSGGKGALYAIKLPQINGSSVLTQYNYALPSFLARSVQYAEPPLVFSPSKGAYGADAQDSLTTAQGWQAIAVGQHLYAWPAGRWPASQGAIPVHVKILSVRGDHRYQVDMNPLITPPVKVQVFNTKTGQNQTVQAPMAVACSWDGGCATYPLVSQYLIPVDWSSYKTTQDFPSDTQAAITSDPVYIPREPLFNGDPAVAFGVASWSHPRVELLDLVTGKAKAIGTSGAGRIVAAIADAGMLATTSSGQYLVYHDEYGNVYTFNLNGSASAAPIWSHSNTIQLAEDGSQTGSHYADATGSVMQPVVSQSSLMFSPLPKTRHYPFSYETYVDPSSPSTVYGAPVSSALCTLSVTLNACRYVSAWSFSAVRSWVSNRIISGPGIEVATQIGNVTNTQGKSYGNYGQLIAANISPYVGPVLDAGPEHYVMSWTNSTPSGGGAIILYAPVNYGVAASAPSSAGSGASITVHAKPVPSGITYNRIQGQSGGICGTNDNPMTLNLTSSIGTSGYLPMTRTTAATVANPWSVWTGNYTLPANTTGTPIKWTGTVQAVDKYCSTATATVTITELPGSTLPPPPPPSSSGSAGLTLNPNPALYGQQIQATLQPTAPPAPTMPSGRKLISWTWKFNASPTLSYPLKPSNWAFGFPVVATRTKTIGMTLAGVGHSATASFMENWWDGGCHTKLPGACTWITNGFWLTGQGGSQYIPARTWPVTAEYTVEIGYTYHPWGVTGQKCADPDSSQESTETTPNDETAEQVCTPIYGWLRKTGAATITLSVTQAQASLNTDGTAIDSVGGG